MRIQEKVVELNRDYYGSFRALTSEEVEKYTKQLNKNDREWYKPYAIREATKDLVCEYDTGYETYFALFVHYK